MLALSAVCSPWHAFLIVIKVYMRSVIGDHGGYRLCPVVFWLAQWSPHSVIAVSTRPINTPPVAFSSLAPAL